MFDKFSNTLKRGLLLVVIGLLNACATNVTVTGKIPAPLVSQLPYNAKLIYTEDFLRYNYEEEEKGRGLRSIAFGEAQVTLFDGIFTNLLNIVDSESLDQNIDMVITPSLLDFQYTAPRETRQNIYEVWLKYRVQVSDQNDQEIADYVIKGYGKTPTALLKSANAAFDSATNIALRDVGAQLAIGFAAQPEIEDYINTRIGGNNNQNITITDAEGIQSLNSDNLEIEVNDLDSGVKDLDSGVKDLDSEVKDLESAAESLETGDSSSE